MNKYVVRIIERAESNPVALEPWRREMIERDLTSAYSKAHSLDLGEALRSTYSEIYYAQTLIIVSLGLGVEVVEVLADE